MTPTLDLAYWGRVTGLLAVETCVLLGVAWIADRLVRHPPHRRTVWQATLLAVGLLWLGELAGSRTLLARLASADREPPIVSVEVLDPNGSLPKPASAAGAGILPAPVSSTAIGAWPAGIWLAVATALVGRFTLGHLGMRRRRSRSLPADPGSVAAANRLAVSLGLPRIEPRIWPGLRSPVAFGIRTPGVALPEDFATRFSPAQRDAMLAHELAHLAARDPLWLTLTGLICSFAWWHPGVWWARRRMQAQMEAAADAASALVPGGREALAESLLAFGRALSKSSPFRGLGMAGAGHPSELARRITRLLEPGARWRPPTRPTTWLATGGALAITLLTLAIAWPGSAVEPLGPTLLARMQRTNKGLLMFRGSPRDAEQVGEILDRLEVATAPRTNSPPQQVTVEVRILEVPEPHPGSGTPGRMSNPSVLEAFFAGIPKQDPPVSTGPPTGTMPGAGSAHAAHFRIEHSRLNGQFVVTSADALGALVRQLVKGKSITQLATPKVTTLSGRAARIQIHELRTVVAGVNAIDATPTNTASIHYITEQVPVGPTIDIVPTAENGAWRVQITSWLSEFLGYDDPAGEVVEAWGLPGTTPHQGTLPLPRLRVREAAGDAKLSPGQAMLIRGPARDHVVRTQATWFRRAKTETHRRRVYYMVTLTP